MTRPAIAKESLNRALSSASVMNYSSIFAGFTAKGIPIEDILPRKNVFTFHAWRALGRVVRKGEHGVKACTFVPVDSKPDAETGEKSSGYRMPRTVTVFHISQTDAMPETE